MVRQLRIWAITVGVLTFLGVPAGLLWAWISPRAGYVIVEHKAYLADPESQALIGTDARFALIGVTLGVLCAVVAYLRAGRRNEVPLALGLAMGGLLASLTAWALGHRFGLSHFEQVTATGADGARVQAPPSLGAHGVVLLWPLLAVAVFGLLESLDLARRTPAPRFEPPVPAFEHEGGSPEAGR
ncbi:MAG: hypothetical protein ABIS86_20255 [Streptosporangiaceae bacterium]